MTEGPVLRPLTPDKGTFQQGTFQQAGVDHQVIDTQFAVADALMVPDNELLRTVRYRHTARDEAAADKKVFELLQRSPYKNKLSNAGLFLRAVAEHAKKLKNLIQPHVGDHIADGGQLRRLSQLMQQASELAPERLVLDCKS